MATLTRPSVSTILRPLAAAARRVWQWVDWLACVPLHLPLIEVPMPFDDEQARMAGDARHRHLPPGAPTRGPESRLPAITDRATAVAWRRRVR